MGVVKDLLIAAEEAGQNEEQARALFDLCDRYGVTYTLADYRPAFDLPKGYVAGRVGGYAIQQSHPTIYVGCSPEGAISS